MSYPHRPYPRPRGLPSTRCRYPTVCVIDALEPRVLMAFDPSAREQESLELLNRMRMNPAAELARLTQSSDPHTNGAIDFFNVNLTTLAQQWESLTPVAPLAWNEALYDAAVDHSEAMLAADAQSHQVAGEPTLDERLAAAGYADRQAWGENIYAFAEILFHAHAGFAIDWGNGPDGIQDPPGHRQNMMSSNYREVGIGIIDTAPGKDVGPLLVTQDFGNRSTLGQPSPMSYLLGVAYHDRNGDGAYDAGEGIGGATVTLTGSSGTFTATSMTAGGYQVLVPGGTYEMTASGGTVGGTLGDGISLGSVYVPPGHNVKRDVTASMASFTTVADGVLTVRGSSANDLIIVGLSSNKTALHVRRNGELAVHPTTGVRRLHVLAGDGYDFVDTTAIASPTYVEGGAGNDTVYTGRGNDKLYGGIHKDKLVPGAGDDLVFGQTHGDWVLAGDGNDTVYGGLGHDTLEGQRGTDRLWGEADDDLIMGGPGGGRLVGGDGTDYLIGGEHGDSLDGAAGNDKLRGLGSRDTLIGGIGTDLSDDDLLDVRSEIEAMLL